MHRVPGVQIVVKEGGAQCGTAGALGAPDAAHESKSFQKKGAQEPRPVTDLIVSFHKNGWIYVVSTISVVSTKTINLSFSWKLGAQGVRGPGVQISAKERVHRGAGQRTSPERF